MAYNQKTTIMTSKSVFSQQVPPAIQDVKIYFSQKGMPEAEAVAFFQFQEKRKWAASEGNSLSEWKTSARRWIDGVIQNRPWLFQRSLR
jgi:hypothetical protein